MPLDAKLHRLTSSAPVYRLHPPYIARCCVAAVVSIW